MKRFSIVFALVAFIFVSCGHQGQCPKNCNRKQCPYGTQAQARKPKNIIFMIGDGMGLTQITGGMYRNHDRLNLLDNFKHIGFIKTYSADDLITDSAAGATAFSCGFKTYNGALGVDTDTIPHETIMETAKKKGLSTGVVVTCSVTHATPAAYYAHQNKRKQMQKNALDLLKDKPNVFMGGGRDYFEKRDDSLNISDELRKAGYEIVYNVNDVTGNTDKVGVLIADGEPETYANLDSTGSDLYHPESTKPRGEYLVPATKTALNILSKNDQGFFVMIEGSQIDWGGHANNTNYITSEMIDFDNAIGAALDFAKKDSNTLIVVTADHETGGFAITDGNIEDKSFTGSFSTHHHTGTLIPVFAYGPGADEFMGTYQNTDIYHKMMQLLGLDEPKE